jgi:AraC family transcriptional regulator of adaptative response / DNA-3-methyladenine glycosylase II
MRLAHGDARFRVEYDAAAPGRPLVLTIGAVDLRDLAPLLSRVRRLLDLDADPVAIDGALAADPRLAASVAHTPGMRMPGAVDPQELLIRAMIGQQVTVAAARTALARLSAAGTASTVPADGLHRLFPTAAQIAQTGFGLLRGPQRRIDSVRAAAEAMASGDLDFGYGDDLPGLGAKLLPLSGVGPWTVGYVAMRVIGAPDVFLANDAAVRNGIRSLAPAIDGATPSPDFRELSPWRSYATMHLWRAAAQAARSTTRAQTPTKEAKK